MSGVGENKNRGDKRRVAASERERVSPSLREKRRCNPVEILPERDCVRRTSRSAGKWMTCEKNLRLVSAEVLRLVSDTAALRAKALSLRCSSLRQGFGSAGCRRSPR